MSTRPLVAAIPGPEYKESFADPKRIPNVHFLGAKPHDAIPAYIRCLDVCLIPYVVDTFTENIFPAILNEYLALGRPVVSSALREVRRFNDSFGGVIAIALGADGFQEAITQALGDASPNAVARRRAVAEDNSWRRRTEGMSELIEAKARVSP